MLIRHSLYLGTGAAGRRRHGYDEGRREKVTGAGVEAADLAVFEAERPRLQAAAFRMLGSLAEAQDAVQETWLRFERGDRSDVRNPAAWLLTVTGRICLDVLRARAAHPELPTEPGLLAAVGDPAAPAGAPTRPADPAEEAELVESVGRALLVVLARLAPAERIAFVLHDLFAVPFDEIGPVLGRTPATAKKLASRARLRVKAPAADPPVDVAWHRRVVEAFLAAARGRDIDGLLAVLDPDVVRRADSAAVPAGARLELRGAGEVSRETVLLWRNALDAAVVLVDGRVGLVIAPLGRLRSVLRPRIVNGLIREYEVIATPERLAALELAVLE
jgi:RNA polymerase sigma factor (sigma-70 family)